MKMSDCMKTIILIGSFIALIYGGMTYFATASDLKQVAMRLENKIVGDTIVQLSERIWSLEKKHEYKPIEEWDDEADVEEYRRLKLEKEQLQKKQDALVKEAT